MKYHFPIETERLSLRLLTPEDLEAWSLFFINNSQLQYVGVTEDAEPLVHAKIWMDRQLARYAETGLGMLAIIEKASGQLIGQVGILQRDLDGETMHEIGYGIIP
jgi:ribosomal-protein-alanine N-acetyltransferase